MWLIVLLALQYQWVRFREILFSRLRFLCWSLQPLNSSVRCRGGLECLFCSGLQKRRTRKKVTWSKILYFSPWGMMGVLGLACWALGNSWCSWGDMGMLTHEWKAVELYPVWYNGGPMFYWSVISSYSGKLLCLFHRFFRFKQNCNCLLRWGQPNVYVPVLLVLRRVSACNHCHM